MDYNVRRAEALPHS